MMEPENNRQDTTGYGSDYHEPVLLAETLAFLAPQPGETILDATLGGGGHSVAIAERTAPQGTLIAFDRDPEAIASAGSRLAAYRQQISIILRLEPFGKLSTGLDAENIIKIQGALFDLGVSSHQLDAERGFSFRRDEPLDMRMSVGSATEPPVSTLLATLSETEIARILWEYGDERFSRKIAARIVERREAGKPLETTGELAKLIEAAIPRGAWPHDIHPATRTFQALRIAVNDELGQLEAGLDAALNRLDAGGRIVVISYHSLEDRIVKAKFAKGAGRIPSAPGSSPAAFLPNVNADSPTLTLLTRKPVTATEAEIARNPRARSAKLRAAQKK